VKREEREPSPLQAWPAITLNTGFALTGFSTVLLGCLLPALAHDWHANDGRLGRLLAAQFAGASIGALLPGVHFQRSAVQGYLLAIGVAAALALSSASASTQFLLQCVLFLCFGIGLGWAMTSTSLLVGTLFRNQRGSALSLLNASWTIGAAACPFVATQWTRLYRPTLIFLPLALCLAAALVGIFASTRGRRVEAAPLLRPPVVSSVSLLVLFAGLAFFYVGVESSVSGWMITFVHRDALSASHLWAPLAASSFWVALLCGRLLAPLVLTAISEDRLFAACIFFAFVGLMLIVASHSVIVIVIAAYLCGLALGPIFPLCISRCLALSGESPHTRYIFAFSGFGGAVLPWVTGLISNSEHSLRLALGVPLVALCLMLVMTSAISRLQLHTH